jgi:hypothetical protein
MKLLIDVDDSNASFILELLNSFSSVKAEQISENDFHKLSPEQVKSIDEGILSLEKGFRLSHDQVVNETKSKYPDIF